MQDSELSKYSWKPPNELNENPTMYLYLDDKDVNSSITI